MSSKRLPLANNTNAVNSPFRTVASLAGKRSRAPADAVAGQPPAKKQTLDLDYSHNHDDRDENQPPRSLIRQSFAQQEQDAKLFLKKPGNAPPTAFERKLAAARKPPSAQKPVQKTTDSLESIRQWQRHYRKAFPQFVFYFESVSDDVRAKVSRQIQYLGAKEEKFFSRSVTHVVTTRPIPAEHASTSFDDGHSTTSRPESANGTLRTIDPSLLGRSQEPSLSGAQKKTADLLEASLQGRTNHSNVQSAQTVEPRKLGVHSTDVLSKARELGIKIWALEKLQRMMTTMFDTHTGEQPGQTKTHTTLTSTLRRGKEADLQQLLRNEKVIGPADRDLAVAAQDTVPFRGYYIYVHDMDERTRPVMVRDYPKVAHKEEGKWPQFRLTPIGRCPFVEDPSHTKKLRLIEEQKAADAEKERQMAAGVPVTRSRAAAVTGTSNPVVQQNSTGQAKEKPDPTEGLSKPLDPPKNIPARRQNSLDVGSMPALFGSAQASKRGAPRFIGGEPVASGVQPSNITSAIRSQIVSSTISSTAPGARGVGASKEITALKRRALERGASATSNESSYLNDMRAAINGDRQPAPRAAKRKAQETLGHIREESNADPSRSRRTQQVRKKVVVEKEMKAGYCENCRDKFEDFDVHVQSRKHRKFAMAMENWQQLDDLLSQLERPLKKAH